MKRSMQILAALALLAAAPVAADPPATAPATPQAIDMPLSHTVRHYKDWQIEQSSAFVSAMTFNRKGALFGLLCGKTCGFYVNTDTPCTAGSAYPGLFNASEGGDAVSVTLRCVHVKEEGVEEEFLLIDEDLSDAIGNAAEIAVAVPLRNGEFRVSRFSMTGAAEAMADMLKMADIQTADAPPVPKT